MKLTIKRALNLDNKVLTLIITTSVLLCLSWVVSAQEKLAITGAQIHTMGPTGIILEGTLLIENGTIKDVISGTQVPSGYAQVDAKGKVITPGFIGALSNLGLVEVGLFAGVNDSRVSSHPISSVGAAFDAQYAINADSTLIGITRIEGFTSAATGLGGTSTLFDGQGAIISLGDELDPLMQKQAFVHVDVTHAGADRNGESRAALWVALNQSLEEALFAASNELTPNQEWDGLITRADANALIPVVKGDTPLLITAHRANDILQALKLKQRFENLDVVLVRASDAWRVAQQISDAKVAVILNPEYNLPGQFDRLGATLENAARLHEAGVTIAIGIDTHNIRLAAQHAGNAVANGLPHEVALAALTLNPAKIFGMDSKIGSLEQGKQADFVIFSGDPLEVTQYAEQVYIQGKPISMESRQTKLRDRYLKYDGKKPVGYVK